MKFSSKSSIYALLACLALFAAVALEVDDETVYNFFASFFGFQTNNVTENLITGEFKQRKNQFSRFNVETFDQQYFINAKHYEDSATDPVVLLVLGSIDDMVEEDIKQAYYFEFARQTKALILGLELRFYGQSQPFSDLQSIKNLGLLNSEQALVDVSRFKKEFPAHVLTKHNIKIGTTAKWVVTGQEYGGSLAAWFRMKFPHDAVAALPLGAPMSATLSYDEFYDRVEKDLKKKQLDDVVNEAYNMINDILKDPKNRKTDLTKLQTDLNICDSLLDENDQLIEDNVNLMFFSITYYLSLMSQSSFYVFTNVQKDSWNILTNKDKGDSLQRLTATITYLMKALKQNCLPSDYNSSIDNYKNENVNELNEIPYVLKIGIGNRTSLFQRCFEFGSFETANTSNMFYRYVPITFYTTICEYVFSTPGLDASKLSSSIAATNRFYGGYNYEGRNAIFINRVGDHFISKVLKDSKLETERIVVRVDAMAKEFAKESSENRIKLKTKYERIFMPFLRWLGKSNDSAANEYEDDPKQKHDPEIAALDDDFDKEALNNASTAGVSQNVPDSEKKKDTNNEVKEDETNAGESGADD